MKKIAFTYGLISGGIVVAMTAIMLPLCMTGVIDFSYSAIIGYTSIVLSFLAVFFGIHKYRQNIGRGAITFGKAFLVGMAITLISCAVYVLSWQIVYYNFIPDFEHRYAALTIQKMREDGASAAAVAAKEQEMAKFTALYANPLYNIAVTFLEVFPVGLIVTLISAAILRTKPSPDAPPAAATAIG